MNDIQNFIHVLHNLSESSVLIRQEAENIIYVCQRDPTMYYSYLLTALQISPEIYIKHMAAILMNKYILLEYNGTTSFYSLSPDQQTFLKDQLIEIVFSTQNLTLLHNLTEVIGSLGSFLIPNDDVSFFFIIVG